jgi:putative PIN family toxin of toxin-antitoxin system
LRVVFDTNVLISAFVFPGGAPETAFRAALSGRITLVTSPALLAELARVLADKFGWEDPMVEAVARQLARIGLVVRPNTPLSVIEQDPDDDRVLEAAREGSADVIVSGDRHLLELGSWEGIGIVRFVELLEELERDPGRGSA